MRKMSERVGRILSLLAVSIALQYMFSFRIVGWGGAFPGAHLSVYGLGVFGVICIVLSVVGVSACIVWLGRCDRGQFVLASTVFFATLFMTAFLLDRDGQPEKIYFPYLFLPAVAVAARISFGTLRARGLLRAQQIKDGSIRVLIIWIGMLCGYPLVWMVGSGFSSTWYRQQLGISFLATVVVLLFQHARRFSRARHSDSSGGLT